MLQDTCILFCHMCFNALFICHPLRSNLQTPRLGTSWQKKTFFLSRIHEHFYIRGYFFTYYGSSLQLFIPEMNLQVYIVSWYALTLPANGLSIHMLWNQMLFLMPMSFILIHHIMYTFNNFITFFFLLSTLYFYKFSRRCFSTDDSRWCNPPVLGYELYIHHVAGGSRVLYHYLVVLTVPLHARQHVIP